jgi:ubiquinone/menaquinone biosynthesis C-methylase UbiE
MNENKKNTFEVWNEQMAQKYNPDDYHNSKNILVRFIEGRRTAAILKLLGVQKEERVIELGCGAGNILEQVICDDRWGVDLSDRMLRLAHARFAVGKTTREQLNVQLLKENVECLSPRIPVQSFDKVYCSEVLEHTEYPEAVILEMKRIVKSGGTIVISIPNERFIKNAKQALYTFGIFRFLFPGMSKAMASEWHIHDFSLQKLREITEKHLKEERVVRIPFFFAPVRYVVRYSVPTTLQI